MMAGKKTARKGADAGARTGKKSAEGSKPKAETYTGMRQKETKKTEIKKPGTGRKKTGKTKSVPGRKAKVFSLRGTHKGDINLPEVFGTEYRPDLIRRAVVFEHSLMRQPYGSDPRAGFRSTADYYSRRRGYYRLTVNRGMSRLPRQKRPGGGLGEVRVVPQARGGHRAHPPKAEKRLAKKMNEREWILALKSAIAATADAELVTGDGRHHVIDTSNLTLPLIVEASFESIKKAGEVHSIFEKLGLADDVKRAANKKTKAGRARTGKRRFRKSVLVVVSDNCPVMNAARNLAGVDVVDADGLNVALLAPGGHPGRLTLWTEGAIEKISS